MRNINDLMQWKYTTYCKIIMQMTAPWRIPNGFATQICDTTHSLRNTGLMWALHGYLEGLVVLPDLPWLVRQPLKLATNRSHCTNIFDFPALPSHSSPTYVSLKMMVLCSFETSGTHYQVARRFVAEERELLHHTTTKTSRFASGTYTKIFFSWRWRYGTMAYFTLSPDSACNSNHYQIWL
jgi:hypothetical protein